MTKSEIKGWSGLLGAFVLLCAAAFPVYQVILWLKEGFWTPMPLYLAFRWLDVDAIAVVSSLQWEGAKIICMWIIALPISVGLLTVAVAQFYAFEWIGGMLAEDPPAIQPPALL